MALFAVLGVNACSADDEPTLVIDACRNTAEAIGEFAQETRSRASTLDVLEDAEADARDGGASDTITRSIVRLQDAVAGNDAAAVRDAYEPLREECEEIDT